MKTSVVIGVVGILLLAFGLWLYLAAFGESEYFLGLYFCIPSGLVIMLIGLISATIQFYRNKRR
ncbi:MAG: hypothetical protein KC423_26195 [Anaerolineales bacterium]|nr:hypothetical protein [Anaerolineales bacterium]MCA9967775.1 hypothetical protein [Anaerolineales bacterium]